MGGIDGTRLTKRLARACVLRDTRRVPENTLASVTRSLRSGTTGVSSVRLPAPGDPMATTVTIAARTRMPL